MSNKIRLAVAGIACFAIAAPVGYALAQEGQGGSDGTSPAQSSPTPPPATSVHPDAETYLVEPQPGLIATCQERLEAAPDDVACQTVALLAAGKLEPGAYTNEAFDQAFAEATASADR